MVGLDGLRGIAVLAVVIYHADLGFLLGGFLGVDIFFVISGFLITSILLKEIELTGAIDRAQFYLRRIRRLFPALVLVLIFSVIATGLWQQDAAYTVRRDLPWALTFVLNWSYIFFDESYFVNMSRPPLLQHLWSLAIEEQFYVIWPLILILLTKVKIGHLEVRKLVLVFSSLGAIAVTLWMAHLSNRFGYPTPNDPSRVYFGTDTHSMGLLLGCATAAIWQNEKLRPKLTPDRRHFLHLIGLLAFGVIGFYLFTISELNSALYQYGFFVVSLATAIAVFLTAHPGLRFGKVLSFKPLVWFGERSYGIYLWHWPIFMLLRPGIDVSWSDNVTAVVRITLVLIISELSYRFVELPIRKGLIGRNFSKWRKNGIPKPSIGSVIASLIAAVFLSTSAFGVVRAPEPDINNILGLGGITAIDVDPTLAPEVAPSPQPMITIPADADAPEPTPEQLLRAANSLVIFGDSVVLSGLEPLNNTLGEISVDAEVGRHPNEIAQRIELRRVEGRLGNDIVIHMGTNGPIKRSDLEPILQALSDRRRVVLVNVQVPRNWMKVSNSVIDELVPLYPNVRLADWHSASTNRRGYFGSDGVHLTKTGGRVFAEIIQQTLKMP